MNYRLYSAFISSVYESLKDERSEIIDCLLDYKFFPICMEHFTVSSDGKFDDIKRFIDLSDCFILILGDEYGSCDENGISWTEREYIYAVEQNKPILALVCKELQELICSGGNNESQKKQIEFYNRVNFSRKITDDYPISRIIGQFFNNFKISECAGWVRGESALSEKELAKWRQEHASFDLAGKWYHVHLSPGDERYIRIGTIDISQNFTPSEYKNMRFEGLNYNMRYSKNDGVGHLSEDMMRRSRWFGEYEFDDEGNTTGFFSVKREFCGDFGEYKVDMGTRRGIHDFSIDIREKKTVDLFSGEFHDEAPSPKMGYIYVFRTAEARLKFLEENFMHILTGGDK